MLTHQPAPVQPPAFPIRMHQAIPSPASSFRRKPESNLRRETISRPNHAGPSPIIPAQAGICLAERDGSSSKPRRHQPRHPGPLHRHSGASQNLTCRERPLTGQTIPASTPSSRPLQPFRLDGLMYQATPAPAPSSRPQPRNPGASRNLPCGERRLAGQTTPASAPSFRRKPESNLRRATPHRPNHLATSRQPRLSRRLPSPTGHIPAPQPPAGTRHPKIRPKLP